MNSDNATTILWRDRYNGLIDFAKSNSWLDDRADFYKTLAFGLRKASGADSVNIRILSPAQDTFILYAFNGDITQDTNREYGILSASAGRMPNLIETGEPIVFDFAHPTSEDINWDRGVEDGFSSAVVIALPGAQGILGAADLLYHDQNQWTSQDIEWLRELGVFVGAVIGNALLTDNMISLRIADERRSLSNEIHDNIAQSLSVITLETDSALDSLAHHDLEMLTRNLDLIKRASNEVESAVRGQLENLRTSIDPGVDPTIDQLVQMGNAFCAQWGLVCDVRLSEGTASMIIPKRTMTQLIRVVNEALVNVVQHAQAQKIVIAFELQDGGLVIVIEDDGLGFEPDNVTPSHLGLRIMQERIDSIGGSLEIASKIDDGTQVRINVPYLV